MFTCRLDKDGLDLLGRLLHYQSKNRVTATNAMRSSFFSCLGPRVHELPPSKFGLDFHKSKCLTSVVTYLSCVHTQLSQSSRSQSASWCPIQARRAHPHSQSTTEVWYDSTIHTHCVNVCCLLLLLVLFSGNEERRRKSSMY